jgi:hypothetical protein
MAIIRDITKEQEQKVWRQNIQFTYVIGATLRHCDALRDETSTFKEDGSDWRDTQDVYALVTARDEYDAMLQFSRARPDICARAVSGWTFDKNAQRVFYVVKFDGRYPAFHKNGNEFLEPKKIHEIRSGDDVLVARFVR